MPPSKPRKKAAPRSRPARAGLPRDVLDVRSGRADAPEGGVILHVPHDGAPAYFEPISVRNSSPTQRAALQALGSTARALQIGADQLQDQVNAARDLGVSWNSIGWMIGLTGDAVRKRFGD